MYMGHCHWPKLEMCVQCMVMHIELIAFKDLLDFFQISMKLLTHMFQFTPNVIRICKEQNLVHKI